MKELDRMHQGGIEQELQMGEVEKMEEEKMRSRWRKSIEETETFEPWTYSSTALLFRSK